MQTRGLLLAGVGLADLALAQLYPVNTTTTTTAAFQVITVVPQIVTAVYTDIFTTYCESATVFIINGEDYSVTTPGHVTLTNCPCTLTSVSLSFMCRKEHMTHSFVDVHAISGCNRNDDYLPSVSYSV